MYGMKALDIEAGSEQIGVLRPLPQAAARHTSSDSDDEEVLVSHSTAEKISQNSANIPENIPQLLSTIQVF